MTLDERDICGSKCEIAVYDGKIRMETSHAFCGVEKGSIDGLPAKLRCKVDDYHDGSINVTRALLIPADMTSEAMESLDETMTTEEETLLNLSVGESCTSGCWNAGHATADNDYLMTDEEQAFVTSNS